MTFGSHILIDVKIFYLVVHGEPLSRTLKFYDAENCHDCHKNFLPRPATNIDDEQRKGILNLTILYIF